MLAYPIELTPDDNDTLLVTCPLLPMVVTYGDTESDARRHAVDAIEVALATMIEDGEDIPVPAHDPQAVRLPLLTSLKIQLYWALRAAGTTKAELADRLACDRESVDSLLDLDDATRLDHIDAAFRALGQEVDIVVREAA